MPVEKIAVGGMDVNCYLYYDPNSKKTIIIDPGDEANRIISTISKKSLTPVGILLTHAHFDHIMAVPTLKEHYNIPVAYLDKEKELFMDAKLNFSGGFAGNPVELKADIALTDNAIYDPFEGTGALKVLHTPGHTSGSACFYSESEGILFSGDTLFKQSIGRTDFYTGDMNTELDSIRNKLFTLPDNTVVYTGHGDITEIGYEKEYNMFVGKIAGN